MLPLFMVPPSLAVVLGLVRACFTAPSSATFAALVVGWVGRVRPAGGGRLGSGGRERGRVVGITRTCRGWRWCRTSPVVGTAARSAGRRFTGWGMMASPGLQTPARKVLATLDREWDGLAAHRDYPMISLMISLDNNVAERALRRPVVTRRNAHGSRNEDPARLAARVWTVTATADMAGLNPIAYLTAYLDTCGRTGGKPPTGPELERFLPWTATRDDLDTWAQPPRPG